MKTLDDLTLIKLLGKGSFGEVYLTSKVGHSELFATKKIPKSLADSEGVRKYFKNEINILQEINHINIMKLIEIKQSKDNYYLVCELCNGGSLNDCLDKYRKINRKAFTEEIVQYLMKQIVDAIKYLHGCHIIHRDLKLDNILVHFNNDQDKKNLNMLGAQVKIIDFGFATKLDPKSNLAFSTLGSPINMDPGILKRLNHLENTVSGYDEKVDIWSLGTLCYEMLIGKATFEAENMRDLVKKIETGEYTLPTSLSKEVVSFLNAMLQYDSKMRLSADELSRHYFLTKNIKDFTKIDINKVQKNLTDDDKLKINVKKNQSIWAIFNNEKTLDDVPGYIINEKEEDSLNPIAEDESVNVNNNNNNINNKYNNFTKNNQQRFNNPGNNGLINNLGNLNVNYYSNQNKNINNNKNYNNNNNQNIYPSFSTANQQAQSEIPIQGQTPHQFRPQQQMQTPQQFQVQSQPIPKKKDLRMDLQKIFNALNNEFVYLDPIFIPIVPGNDPIDKYNEDENI